VTDIVTIPHFDASERKFTFNRVQDVEPILERNKALQSGTGDTDLGRHIATIPNVVIEKWLHEDGVSYQEMMSKDGFERLVKRKLRDPDWAHLRTTSKRF